MRKVSKNGMSDYQLALVSSAVFDVGPRTRSMFLLFGVLGIALAFMQSLESHQQVELDKIIHFSGYATLSVVFVLALRPILFLPGLVGLLAMSIGIEFLQRYTGRSFDVQDMVANTIGVITGGCAGFVMRAIHSFIRREMAVRRVRDSLYSYQAGEVMISEGDPINDMYIIKSGRVSVSRFLDGKDRRVLVAEPGHVLGILGVVEDRPQYATLRAIDDVVVYRMGMAELMRSAGGAELPVSLVLTGLSQRIRWLAGHLEHDMEEPGADSTLA